MKIYKSPWGNWEDIEVREAANGEHFLLQMRTSFEGEKKFKNVRIDRGLFSWNLFHGFQNIKERILN